jgi:hypothetical protein
MQVKPRSFDPYPGRSSVAEERVAVPDNLPAPVARYFQAIDVDQDGLPVIRSAVLSGRASMRLNGVPLQARFRFVHAAGEDYRHYIEGTWFGLPLLVVNERYVDGISLVELPFGTSEDLPNNNQGANLGLWGESIWLPPVFLTDPRVRWEAVDQDSARLIVPFEDGEDEFVVWFDPDSGLIARMEADRFKGERDEQKTRWILEPGGWEEFHGMLVPSPASARWADESQPWAVFVVEEIVHNVDVSEYVRRKGL